jgi:hypothetical protein
MSTLVTIRGNVQRNLSDTGTKLYFTPAELNQFISEAYKNYVIRMIEEGAGYFKTRTNLALTSGSEAIDLSALTPVFFSISRIERQSEQERVPLIPSERRYLSNITYYASGGLSYQPSYRLRDLSLILEPAPQFSESASATTGLGLEYNYLPTFPTSASADNFTFTPIFSTLYEPMIELYATIAALESKDGSGGVSDINSFRSRLEKWEARFEDSLTRVEEPDEVQFYGFDYNLSSYFW